MIWVFKITLFPRLSAIKHNNVLVSLFFSLFFGLSDMNKVVVVVVLGGGEVFVYLIVM